MFNNNNRKCRKDVFLWILVVIMMAAIASGDIDNTIIRENEQTTENTITELGKSSIDIGPDGVIKSISFRKDAEIRDVLRFLGVKYNKNIVPSPKVDGTITVTSLYNVTFAQAMDAILGDSFEWAENGNIIDVYTKEDKNRMTYKVFILSYVSAEEAKKLITPILSSAGSIGTSSAAETALPTDSTISEAAGGDTMASQDTIVIYDYPERILQAEQIINTVDKKPRQVLIEATILSVTLREGMEFGVDLNLMAGTHIEESTSTSAVSGVATDEFVDSVTSPISQIASGIAGTMMETSGFAQAGDGLRIGIRSGDFSAFITALESITDTTILANPKILAINKQLGQVYIGTKIGYVSQTNQTQTSTTQEVEFLETGTKLSFRPYIGNDGYIRMDIYPKDSSGTLKTNDIPDESSTELATNVLVRDGETIVIGGLFRDVTVTTRNQIPFFGDLPLVGGAFRNTSDVVQRQEVIVLLTPHIIEEPSDTRPTARMDDIRRKRAAASKQVQFVSRAKQADEHYAEAAKLYLEGLKGMALEKVNQAIQLRPTYLEALRLKERILKETDPDASIQSIIIENVERPDTERFMRK